VVRQHESRDAEQPQPHRVRRDLLPSPPRHREHFGSHIFGLGGTVHPSPRELPDVVEILREQSPELFVGHATSAAG
jgi:hypothetical protein